MLIEEYRALKAEQTARIGVRDNLMYATFAAVGAVVYATVHADDPDLLLGVPLPVLVLGWTYLAGDRKVAELRHYIRASLAPRVAEAHGVADDLLRWETGRNGRTWTFWRIGQLVVNLAMFVLPAACAIGAWAGLGDVTAVLAGLAAVETVGVLAVAMAVIVHARRRYRPRLVGSISDGGHPG